MSKVYVIYHGNCYDGFGAAWVAKKCMPEAVLLPGTHGQPIPAVPDGSLCYMIDISYPREEMEALALRVSLRVLDHHKTAEANLKGFPNTVFDMKRSGAMLAFNEFFPNKKAPRLIQYVQDQDLWNWNLQDSEAICSYIRSYPRELKDWDYLEHAVQFDHNSCRAQGVAIMRADSQRIEEMCEQVQWLEIGGYKVPIVNATTNFSAVGASLCEKYPEAAFAGYYLDRADGQRQWGLRSTGFDVSAIAKFYGGGGHKTASGFQTKLTHSME
jgi:oligoribonuclease NrnB/cAMP/cGMP phosphodiesterase (DHH superfamily)